MQMPIAIIGVGRTRFGEHYELDPEDLIDEAGLMALDSAGIERRDLDACYISDYLLQVTNKIGLEEGFISQLLEMNIPIEKMRSFSSALLNACNAIEAGRYDIVLVGGMEKMTDRWSKIRDNLMLLVDHWSYYAGGTPESIHELLLREYIKEYNIRGDDRQKLMEVLAEISVKNHRNAIFNEYAHLRREIDVKRVFAAREEEHKMLGMYDFAPISDGATAIVLASPKKARGYTDNIVYILASSLATDFISYPARPYRTGFIASKIAMEKALKMANLSLDDIKLLEIYDQSTVFEMISLEDLGFVKKGSAWIRLHENFESWSGFYHLEGRQIFVNTNGGLKADGNPLGATGGAQVFEVVKQLKGEAGQRQIKPDGDLIYGCVQEIEGFGTKV
ncbi:MAG: thiolase family protein, partial [Candidatus Bathyarchaeota archaeon]|nr:thiolase family protein [Candidatus Bathyarchaeota archaeon]